MLELLGLHEAGWWALVERVEAALGLVGLALGGLSLLAVALAAIEWVVGRRAARVPAPLVLATHPPVMAASRFVATVAMRAPARRNPRVRTRTLIRHLAGRVVCPIRGAARRQGGPLSPAALPVDLIATTGR